MPNFAISAKMLIGFATAVFTATGPQPNGTTQGRDSSSRANRARGEEMLHGGTPTTQIISQECVTTWPKN